MAKKQAKIKQVHSWYVDINSGIPYRLPNTVDGDTPYVVKPKFYEITEAQAIALDEGEPLDKVIREAAELKIQAEVNSIKAKAEPLVEPEEPTFGRKEAEEAVEVKPEPVVQKATAKKATAKKATAKKATAKKD